MSDDTGCHLYDEKVIFQATIVRWDIEIIHINFFSANYIITLVTMNEKVKNMGEQEIKRYNNLLGTVEMTKNKKMSIKFRV